MDRPTTTIVGGPFSVDLLTNDCNTSNGIQSNTQCTSSHGDNTQWYRERSLMHRDPLSPEQSMHMPVNIFITRCTCDMGRELIAAEMTRIVNDKNKTPSLKTIRFNSKPQNNTTLILADKCSNVNTSHESKRLLSSPSKSKSTIPRKNIAAVDRNDGTRNSFYFVIARDKRDSSRTQLRYTEKGICTSIIAIFEVSDSSMEEVESNEENGLETRITTIYGSDIQSCKDKVSTIKFKSLAHPPNVNCTGQKGNTQSSKLRDSGCCLNISLLFGNVCERDLFFVAIQAASKILRQNALLQKLTTMKTSDATFFLRARSKSNEDTKNAEQKESGLVILTRRSRSGGYKIVGSNLFKTQTAYRKRNEDDLMRNGVGNKRKKTRRGEVFPHLKRGSSLLLHECTKKDSPVLYAAKNTKDCDMSPITHNTQSVQKNTYSTSADIFYFVTSNEKKCLSDFMFFLLAQVTRGVMAENDLNQANRRRNSGLSVGYLGMRCRHCGGRERGHYFPTSCKNLQACPSMINKHLLKCDQCPTEIKHTLKLLKAKHKSQVIEKKPGMQLSFFSKFWERIHDVGYSTGTNSINKDVDSLLQQLIVSNGRTISSRVLYSAKFDNSQVCNEETDHNVKLRQQQQTEKIEKDEYCVKLRQCKEETHEVVSFSPSTDIKVTDHNAKIHQKQQTEKIEKNEYCVKLRQCKEEIHEVVSFSPLTDIKGTDHNVKIHREQQTEKIEKDEYCVKIRQCEEEIHEVVSFSPVTDIENETFSRSPLDTRPNIGVDIVLEVLEEARSTAERNAYANTRIGCCGTNLIERNCAINNIDGRYEQECKEIVWDTTSLSQLKKLVEDDEDMRECIHLLLN